MVNNNIEIYIHNVGVVSGKYWIEKSQIHTDIFAFLTKSEDYSELATILYKEDTRISMQL
ncbi:hypothetical protein BDV26DRAFT_271623 [Aspergillus bertholletiae]|uniref:Uncharacterized protein n=1 Tax=Aspergillus bertholletiae TaxID=1226010 RepID=A0A5N7AV84_9EURO|nr:hypothetical protein BDV26DRAFT_271623 [Aspergillus bertholletiae]